MSGAQPRHLGRKDIDDSPLVIRKAVDMPIAILHPTERGFSADAVGLMAPFSPAPIWMFHEDWPPLMAVGPASCLRAVVVA